MGFEAASAVLSDVRRIRKRSVMRSVFGVNGNSWATFARFAAWPLKV